MLEFYSPVIHENVWKISLKTNKELRKIYFEGRKEEKKEELGGVIEYSSSTIYIDKELDDDLLGRALRKQLMNLYLWETGQQDHLFTEEEFCDLTSVAAPLICKTADNIILMLKKDMKDKERR